MQVILDSLFARPGSAPIWRGKKGEFGDWTRVGPNNENLRPCSYNSLAEGYHKSLYRFLEQHELLKSLFWGGHY